MKICSSFPSLVMVSIGGGAGVAPSRKCSICAPLIWGSTMAFQRRKIVLVSFSDGGGPREIAAGGGRRPIGESGGLGG